MRPYPAVCIVLAAVPGLATVCSADTVISLGDSIGWGYTVENQMTPSYGDQPWVSLWADALASGPGGRPDVLNLAIPGESTGSFFAGGEEGVGLNLNYDGANPQTQAGLFAQHAADLRSGGGDVRVAVTLGANDLLSLIFDPAFLLADPDQQNAMIDARIAEFRPGYAAVLALAAAELPNAELVVLNYFNPVNAWLADGDPTNDGLAQLADGGIRRLNMAIAEEAAALDARVADIYSAFYGREAELTSFLTDFDVHPTLEGYGVIAGVVIPGPGSAWAIAGLATFAARRRRPSPPTVSGGVSVQA